uniref:Uncharacterized protein n=1 Tax=Trichogramma kaykai TaxID=54128 RepID=A0ABD2WYE9_9HYME
MMKNTRRSIDCKGNYEVRLLESLGGRVSKRGRENQREENRSSSARAFSIRTDVVLLRDFNLENVDSLDSLDSHQHYKFTHVRGVLTFSRVTDTDSGSGSITTSRSPRRGLTRLAIDGAQHSHDGVGSENHTHKRAPDVRAKALLGRMTAPEARTTLTRRQQKRRSTHRQCRHLTRFDVIEVDDFNNLITQCKGDAGLKFYVTLENIFEIINFAISSRHETYHKKNSREGRNLRRSCLCYIPSKSEEYEKSSMVSQKTSK